MRIILSVLFLASCIYANAQRIVVSGYLKDDSNGESILYATCYDSISAMLTTTNTMGSFNFEVTPNHKLSLKISHLGYFSKSIEIISPTDTILIIRLKPKSELLNEVNVTELSSFQKHDVLGKISVPKSAIQSLPSFVGLPDLMKAITFLPGISGGREGYSNIYVRGGDRGQNLILLDGIKLYNTNHVGGFLSVINSEILKHVDVYKGGVPARYGGRASSVIDIHTMDGNKNELHGNFNIGVLNSGLLLEGPISEKWHFFVAGRTSYFNLFNYVMGSTEDEFNQVFKYSIYDVNSKVTWQPNLKHKVSLSIFTGRDDQESGESYNNWAGNNNELNNYDSGMQIATIGFSLLYRAKLLEKLYNENLVSYSNYNNKSHSTSIRTINNNSITEKISSFSNIEDYSFKSRFDYYHSNSYTIRGGLETSYYQFVPGLQNQTYENQHLAVVNDSTIGFSNKLQSTEFAAYLENEMDLSAKLKLIIGLRGVSYFCKDTSFFRLEPRLSLRYLVNEALSFKANYTMINQFNHVLVNNMDGFEREIWFSATKELLPQHARQAAVGLFYENSELALDLSLEAYYKRMSNLQEYRSPLLEEDNLDNISNIVASNGIGKARGFEFFAKKEFSKLNLNINYTLSWSDRKFEALNNGNWFPFIYDRRHDFSIVTLYNFSKKYSLSTNFIYTTGASVTLPIGLSKDDDLVYRYYLYGSMNNRKLPPYHRLDLSVCRKTTTKSGNISRWSMNLFNAYARINPVYVYYDSNTGKIYQKSLFRIVPTISYSYEF